MRLLHKTPRGFVLAGLLFGVLFLGTGCAETACLIRENLCKNQCVIDSSDRDATARCQERCEAQSPLRRNR